jgi:hypothetical protein
MLPASGSVIENPLRISPFSNGSSHCLLCSSVANQVQRLYIAGVGRSAVDRFGASIADSV